MTDRHNNPIAIGSWVRVLKSDDPTRSTRLDGTIGYVARIDRTNADEVLVQDRPGDDWRQAGWQLAEDVEVVEVYP